MTPHIHYPLTTVAKEFAHLLVQAWDSGKLPQLMRLFEIDGDGGNWGTGFKRTLDVDFEAPDLSVWLELAEFKLVRYIPQKDNRHESTFDILLLQELRNAVQNNFEVSDFFLTTSAVGTIIYGNLHMQEGSNFQSGATNFGDVRISADMLPDKLIEMLGDSFLQKNAEVAAAIEGLKTANQLTQRSKLAKVIEELGRCLEHTANAGTAIAAIGLIHHFLASGVVK